MYWWKVHVKCWDMIVLLMWSVELPERQISWSMGKVLMYKGSYMCCN